MTTLVRWAACALLAAAVFPAFARSPMSNEVGDGEANVPFATSQPAAPDELGGGSGEPGRIETRDAAELARQAEADREFLSHVWTDP